MAKPKLCLIPAAQGSKFYSVLPSSGVGDFNFTRGSAATRINKDGLIETVANGVSRLNYPLIDGVVKGCPSHLLEPSRLQKIQYSEDIATHWSAGSSTITPNQGISPNGTLNADLVSSVSVNGNVSTSHTVLNDSLTTTQSIFVKHISGTSNFMLRGAFVGGTAIAKKSKFNLATSSVISTDTTASIEYYGKGWYRLSQQISNNSSGNTTLVFQNFTTNDIISTNELLLWGAQSEVGSYPTSYIPNYGTAAGVTRSAETASGAGDASTFNDSEGVLMVESSLLDVSQDGNRISISDGSSAENRITFRYLNDNEIQIELGLTNGFSEILNLDNSENFNKIAVVYNSTNVSVFINGFNLVTDTMSALSGLSQLQFNRFNANTENFYGNTKQIQYFDTALNDSDLETLTSWTSFTDLANGQLYSIK